MQAALEGVEKRAGLSMLTIGIPLVHAMIAGGMQKLLPALTTKSNPVKSSLAESMNAFASRSAKMWMRVFGPRGFIKNSTFPSLLNPFSLKMSPSGTRKNKDTFE